LHLSTLSFLVTYNSPTGIKIEQAYQLRMQTDLQKILGECIDGTKAAKLAGEIAAKASKYIAFAYIAEQFIEGSSKGLLKGLEKALLAGLEIKIGAVITEAIAATFGLPFLTSATASILIMVASKYIIEILIKELSTVKYKNASKYTQK